MKINYKSQRWLHKRRAILHRDLYECQESRRFGKAVLGNTIHHIYPVELFPQLAWCDWNLVTLTPSMHNKMHDRVTNEITELGKDWQRRFRRQFNKEKERLGIEYEGNIKD